MLVSGLKYNPIAATVIDPYIPMYQIHSQSSLFRFSPGGGGFSPKIFPVG